MPVAVLAPRRIRRWRLTCSGPVGDPGAGVRLRGSPAARLRIEVVRAVPSRPALAEDDLTLGHLRVTGGLLHRRAKYSLASLIIDQASPIPSLTRAIVAPAGW